jgi:hypothetical protein
MNGNGEDTETSIEVGEPIHVFNNDEVIRAIYDYVLKRGLKHGEGLAFDWEITLMDGAEIPPEDIREIKVRCYLGDLNNL